MRLRREALTVSVFLSLALGSAGCGAAPPVSDAEGPGTGEHTGSTGKGKRVAVGLRPQTETGTATVTSDFGRDISMFLDPPPARSFPRRWLGRLSRDGVDVMLRESKDGTFDRVQLETPTFPEKSAAWKRANALVHNAKVSLVTRSGSTLKPERVYGEITITEPDWVRPSSTGTALGSGDCKLDSVRWFDFTPIPRTDVGEVVVETDGIPLHFEVTDRALPRPEYVVRVPRKEIFEESPGLPRFHGRLETIPGCVVSIWPPQAGEPGRVYVECSLEYQKTRFAELYAKMAASKVRFIAKDGSRTEPDASSLVGGQAGISLKMAFLEPTSPSAVTVDIDGHTETFKLTE